MQGLIERVRRAFAEFLTIPTLMIVAFLLLGALAYWLDQLRIERGWVTIVSGSHESVTTLLGTIAASIITVTSITFSLLLIAVQQSAAALTGQVYDQFLRRRSNQAYFGFFIGLALYCLVILATVREDYTPIYGAALAFGLIAVALFMLILLIYSSIDQMRPVSIVRNIRDHSLAARKSQAQLLASTKAQASDGSPGHRLLVAQESGFMTALNIRQLDQLCRDCGADEIVVLRCIGDYLSVGQELFELRFSGPEPERRFDEQLLRTARLEHKRDLGSDPGFGIEQLATIAWTTISTSKQNPQPGRLTCRALRDLLAHWYDGGAEGVKRGGADCRIVLRDHVPVELLRGFETLIVVASESMQHQTLAEVYRALALAMRRLTGALRDAVEDTVLRSLSMLGDHALTAELDEAIAELAEALPAGETRSALKQARDRLAATWGLLNSRGTRVQNAGS